MPPSQRTSQETVVLQKVVATVLAIPVLAIVYAATLVRRAGSGRSLMAVLALGLTAFLIVTAIRPAPATGILPAPPSALDPALFTPIVETGDSPSAAVVIRFPSAMNTASVEHDLRIDPTTAVRFAWNVSGTVLTVTPTGTWTAATFHTVTIDPGVLDSTGRPLDHQIKSVFLTRAAVVATLSATGLVAGAATAASRFRVVFSGPVDAATIRFDIAPVMVGLLAPAMDSTATQPAFEFTPDKPLPAGASFTIGLAAGARDPDGGVIAASAFTITTASPPTVVRFRPVNADTGVGWTQDLSVRFSQPMDRPSAEKAWSTVQAGTALAGTFSWAENDTVLVFNPTVALGYGQRVTLTVGGGATSAAGVPLAAAATATFTTAARPSPAATPAPAAPPAGGSGGGGSAGSSTWSAVEAYYLTLMNCTRTGGTVGPTGACSGGGSRNVAPLWQDAGISAAVSRPYATKLAVTNQCTHFAGGTPGDRLRAAGYTSYRWAENLGCQSGNPYTVALNTQLFFQSERSYNGGHYVNLMNPAYDRVGIGISVSGGRVLVVIDFYHP